MLINYIFNYYLNQMGRSYSVNDLEAYANGERIRRLNRDVENVKSWMCCFFLFILACIIFVSLLIGFK